MVPDWKKCCGAIGIGGGWSDGWPVKCTNDKNHIGPHSDYRFPELCWLGDVMFSASPIRLLLLARIEEIRSTSGSDRFGTKNRNGNFRSGVYWDKNFDFSVLNNEKLLSEFERVVAKSYQQR